MSEWTCSASATNYFVGSYSQMDGAVTTGRPGSADQRTFHVVDTWIHLVVGEFSSLDSMWGKR